MLQVEFSKKKYSAVLLLSYPSIIETPPFCILIYNYIFIKLYFYIYTLENSIRTADEFLNKLPVTDLHGAPP
jgi:hypothetical protein